MKFLFICGCGHTGTSLMLSIFASTNNVVAITDETSFLLKYSLDEFKEKIKIPNNDIKLVVEKTPLHVHALDKICQDHISEALVMLRNPVDVVASLKKRGGVTIETAIERYYKDNLQWLNRSKTPNLRVLKYEDLVSNKDKILKRLGDVYGVNLLQGDEFRKNSKQIFFQSVGAREIRKTDGFGERNHLALRNYQMRQPISNLNGQWRERLSQHELDLVLVKLESLIDKLGYNECFDYKIDTQ